MNTLMHHGYVIQSNGVIISKAGKPLSHHINKQGYFTLNLRIHSRLIHHRVHRLVAISFIPNPSNLPQVNHIDGDKSNNDVSNLEWVSDQDNHDHARRLGLKGKLSDEDILSIKELIKSGKLQKDIASIFGVSKSTITRWKQKLIKENKYGFKA